MAMLHTNIAAGYMMIHEAYVWHSFVYLFTLWKPFFICSCTLCNAHRFCIHYIANRFVRVS